ncbi:hypothetical protein BamIOP4010DRAFT_3076 [Burkholderia ambifaria IOP40-10]|uniref:Uncharacterized protein n=1 Tax=Burkholderia ambifaria IOP40-10 TaxID=396596 RepID=B1FGB6_9BURK|nr:hypothetical protein BamIOP4010DRAFT_3076 [Burkholderia ambifaria IOP40-10]
MQPLNQLHRERIVQYSLLITRDERLRLHPRLPAFTEQAIRERVGVEPRAPVVDDLIREPPQVFDQHDPQRDRHRPQFTDRQRFHGLIGQHETAQRIGIETTVGMGDE